MVPEGVEAFGGDGDRGAEFLREEGDAEFFEEPAVLREEGAVVARGLGEGGEGGVALPEGLEFGELAEVGGRVGLGAADADAAGFEVAGKVLELGGGDGFGEAGEDEPRELFGEVVEGGLGQGGGGEEGLDVAGVVEDGGDEAGAGGVDGVEAGAGGGEAGVEGVGVADGGLVFGEGLAEGGGAEFLAEGGGGEVELAEVEGGGAG